MPGLLQEIAQRLGLSPSTVSRAARGLDGVSPETRILVEQAMRDSGLALRRYRRRPPAEQAEPTARSIGVLICDNSSGGMPSYVQGICRAAQELGVDVHVALVPRSTADRITAKNLKTHLPVLQKTALDGIVLIYAWPQAAVEAIARRCPCVSIVHQTYLTRVDHLMLGTEDAVRRLALHLWSDVERHAIGFFGACSGLTWSRQALLYLRQEMDLRGAALPAACIIAAPEDALLGTDPDWSQPIAAAVDSTRAGTTAWVCPNGLSAEALIAGLRAAGLDVPGAVSVAAVDASDRPRAGITTVRFSGQDTGAMAFSLLYERQSHPRAEGRTILISARDLVPGETTLRRTVRPQP